MLTTKARLWPIATNSSNCPDAGCMGWIGKPIQDRGNGAEELPEHFVTDCEAGCLPPHRDRGSISAVTTGDDERSAAALPLRSQQGFGDLVRSSQSYDTGA
jgi:hypothetical protein